MTRSLLRTLAWIFAAALLYGSVLLLEFYWNVLNWRPRWDGVAAGLLLGAVLGMAAMAWVAWRGFDALTRSVSFVTSVFLLAAALHALPPETVSEGFTGRETPSPIWYEEDGSWSSQLRSSSGFGVGDDAQGIGGRAHAYDRDKGATATHPQSEKAPHPALSPEAPRKGYAFERLGLDRGLVAFDHRGETGIHLERARPIRNPLLGERAG